MNPITIRIALTLAALGAGLLAQAGETHPIFEKAVLVEESECDPAGALALFQQVAADAAVPAALRSRAWLRAGLCLRKLGRDDEARAAFEKAAQGEGETAEHAEAALRGEDPVESARLQSRVQYELKRIGTSEESDRLVWMGRLAAPHLAAALEARNSNLSFVKKVASILFQIGGPDAERYLQSVARSKDPLLQRAVLQALRSVAKTPELHAAAKPFLRDPVPQVRLQAYEALRGGCLSMEEAFSLAQDPDATVASTVLLHLVAWRSAFAHGDDEHAEVADLFVLAREALLRPEPEVRFAAVHLAGQWLRYEVGRSYFFDTLPRSDLAEYFRQLEAQKRSISLDLPKELSASSSVVRAVADKLGTVRPRQGSTRPEMRQEALAKIIGRALRVWDRGALEDVIALAALGYDGELGLRGDLTKWAVEGARPGEAAVLAGALESWGNPGPVLKWLWGEAPSAEILEPLRFWMQKHLAEVPPTTLAKDKAFTIAIRTLGLIPSMEAVTFVDEVIDRIPELATLALEAVCARRDPQLADGLLHFVAREGGSNVDMEIRSIAWARLCALGCRKALPHLPVAYREGMNMCRLRSPQWRNLGSRRGLRWLLADFDQQNVVTRGPQRIEYEARRLRFAESDLRATFEACLALDLEAVWQDALMIAEHWKERNSGRIGGGGRLAEHSLFSLEVYRALAARAPECPIPELKSKLSEALLGIGFFAADAARVPLAARLLGSDDPKLQRQALDALRTVPDLATGALVRSFLEATDPALVRTAIRILRDTEDPSAVADLAPLLIHAEMEIRRDALRAIAALAPERAVELCLPLLEDPDSHVRSAVCAIFRTKLDRRAVPALIEALKDEEDDVRKAALSALSAIRLWAEQHAKWKGLLEGSGLDAPNAAEALVEQAGADNEKKIRIAAIQSLGTLAVAETLPFLIKLMSDEDSDVAAAAEAAVAKINAGKGTE